ncbi:hypothetical protein Ciccas_011337 [Cichlidogyrus casuarinus]|uniref:Uncharacterized protein n=1 Tax=Cichlidogyrus casuarinus TaxID=1844966 RepID=A0ABD2PS74_9PLAT
MGLRFAQNKCSRTRQRSRDEETSSTGPDSGTLGPEGDQQRRFEGRLTTPQLEELGRNLELLNDPRFIEVLEEYDIALPRLPRYRSMHRSSTLTAREQAVIEEFQKPKTPPPPPPPSPPATPPLPEETFSMSSVPPPYTEHDEHDLDHQ